MLRLNLSRDARKFLDALPAKQFRQIVTNIFDLMKNPAPHDSKKLTGFDYLRADIGEYRMIYDVQDDVLRIIVIGKRNDGEVYKSLQRISS